MSYITDRIQGFLPQHFLSKWVGKLTHCTQPLLKSFMIQAFIKRYKVDMSEAILSNPTDYASFHQFFIRRLRSEVRPINTDKQTIISPVDAVISQIGRINHDQLIQAKGFYFTLADLLAKKTDDPALAPFIDGEFCTLYLAPRDYHHVHIPFEGHLRETTYVPGRLFSVNHYTAEHVPHLFSRNERLICYFDSAFGPFVLVMVGAFLVGSITTAWAGKICPPDINQIQTTHYGTAPVPPLEFKRGDDLGYFSLGSTVILLFPKQAVRWQENLICEQHIKMGSVLAHLTHSVN